MDVNTLILCVDDEPINLVIMEEMLQDSYELTLAANGEDCLEQVAACKPDLILLDVNMPDMDGLEICRRLRAGSETTEIPIIFVSVLASQNELMAGYEAGGDDYITKPFSEEILQKKIEILLASQRRKEELRQRSENAAEALRETRSTTEELDMVVKFLHRAQTVDTLDELAGYAFDCLHEFELDGSLLILDEPQNRVWFSDDIDRPMEAQILESLRGQDRVLSFGTRLAINSDHATILVRNLPSGTGRIERVREQLAILIEGLDTRIHAMQAYRLLERRREVLARVLDATCENLGKIDELHKQQKARSGELLALMGAELEKSLLQLDLTPGQEKEIRKIIESTLKKNEAIYDDGLKIDDQFCDIIGELSSALDE